MFARVASMSVIMELRPIILPRAMPLTSGTRLGPYEVLTPLGAGVEEVMRLEPGTWLGPYEILSAIGACGTGDVYRAVGRRSRLE